MRCIEKFSGISIAYHESRWIRFFKSKSFKGLIDTDDVVKKKELKWHWKGISAWNKSQQHNVEYAYQFNWLSLCNKFTETTITRYLWSINMKGATPELLSLLQRRPANIRNICILAHVDHGKGLCRNKFFLWLNTEKNNMSYGATVGRAQLIAT